MNTPLRIILVSDSSTWLARVGADVSALEEIQVLQTVPHGIETLTACYEKHPDIVLLDLSTAPSSIVTLLNTLHHFIPTLHIIGWTARYEADIASLVTYTHAASYLIDRDMHQSLQQVFTTVMMGILWYSTLL